MSQVMSQGAPLVTDIAVIGAGPTGLFAVFEAGMLNMRCAVLDALDMPGGQCAALYPEKPIYDIPAQPSILAQELVDRLVTQAAPFDPVYRLGHAVTALRRRPEGGWEVENAAGERVHCRAILIAAGAGAFGPNKPPLAGIEKYEGKSVFYLVRRREDFRGRRVVIAGGGDSAVDWALSLVEVAERVMVLHRRDRFRAAPDSERKLKELAAAGKLDLVVPYQLARLEGDGTTLSGVVVENLDGDQRTLKTDSLLALFGLAMSLGPIAEFGLHLEHSHIRIDPATCATDKPGIFAIGDIVTYPGKLKLILSGFAEAAMAMHAIYPLVHPDKALHFEYSTSRGVPGG